MGQAPGGRARIATSLDPVADRPNACLSPDSTTSYSRLRRDKMLSRKARPRTILRPLTVTLPLFIPAAVATDAGMLKAQTASWVRVEYSSPPPARENSSIAYDAATHSTVLFGGADGRSVDGDTWTWDGTWSAMYPAASPSPRQGAAMSFDGAAGNVVFLAVRPLSRSALEQLSATLGRGTVPTGPNNSHPSLRPHGCGQT